MRTETKTLIKALHVLANDIQSEDSVANACIFEAVQRLEELNNEYKSKNEAITTAVKAARKSWAKSANPLPVLEETLRQFNLFSLQKINDETSAHLLTVHVSGVGEFEYTGELDKILADAIQTTMDGEE